MLYVCIVPNSFGRASTIDGAIKNARANYGKRITKKTPMIAYSIDGDDQATVTSYGALRWSHGATVTIVRVQNYPSRNIGDVISRAY